MAAAGRFLVTTLLRYARVNCLHVEQLHVSSMGLYENTLMRRAIYWSKYTSF